MGFAVLEKVATFGGFESRTHGFDGEWSYRGENLTWCGKRPNGNLSRTHHERSTLVEVTCKGCLRTVGDVVTVMVLEPCCDNGAPWGERPEDCHHRVKRVPTFTEHTTLESARAEFAKTRGWGSTDGYVHNGVMPPVGERFRIMPVAGSLSSVDGYVHSLPVALDFPTAQAAAQYAAQWHEYPDGKRHRFASLVNVVGDRDTRVRWSSYGVEPGTELTPHEHA